MSHQSSSAALRVARPLKNVRLRSLVYLNVALLTMSFSALRRPVAGVTTGLLRQRPLGATCPKFFSSSGGSKTAFDRFWNWTTQVRPSWKENKTEAAVVFCVFGITGSTSVAFVRPCLKNTFGLEGNMIDGPWSYRIISLVAVSPIYAVFLLTFGTLSGRHTFFAMMATKIYGRFLPAAVTRRLACPPAIKARQQKPPTPQP